MALAQWDFLPLVCGPRDIVDKNSATEPDSDPAFRPCVKAVPLPPPPQPRTREPTGGLTGKHLLSAKTIIKSVYRQMQCLVDTW